MRVAAAYARAARALGAVARDARVLGVCALLGVMALRVAEPSLFDLTRYAAMDAFQRAHPNTLEDRHVAIIDVDEASIAELGQWPWPRSEMARLVDGLTTAGVRAIGFDIVFSEADRLSPDAIAQRAEGLPPVARGLLAQAPNTDDIFAASIAAAPVALGASAREGGAEASPGQQPRKFDLAVYNGDPRRHLFGFPSMLPNLRGFAEAAQGEGLFTLTPEHDGVIRRTAAMLRVGDQIWPSLALETLRVAEGARGYGLVRSDQGAGVVGVRLAEHFIPTDENGRIWLHIAPHNPSLYVSAADVIKGRASPDALKDKIVLVGTSAVGLRDLRRTPIEAAIPGVEIHAQVIDAVMRDDYLHRPYYLPAAEHLATLAGGIAIALLTPALSAVGALPLYLALSALAAGGAFFAFRDFGLAVDATYPILAWTAAFAAAAYAGYSRAEAQRRQIRQAFSHYLSPDLVARLSDEPDALKLGGETREMTFLFCDLAGFTGFVEKAEPKTLVSLLNEYLDGVCGVVMSHGGTIDKIVGDAVHAMFNAPMDEPRHAERAVACALEIEAFVTDFRARMQAAGHAFGETRIGVNTGPAVVGNFGGSRRFDYTAHGDAINTAARLEGANKYLGTTICVAASTAAQCENIQFRPIAALRLKGKDFAVETFEPIRPSSSEADARAYASAFEAMRAGAQDAQAAFAALVRSAPRDPLAALHLRRLSSGEVGAEIIMDGK